MGFLAPLAASASTALLGTGTAAGATAATGATAAANAAQAAAVGATAAADAGVAANTANDNTFMTRRTHMERPDEDKTRCGLVGAGGKRPFTYFILDGNRVDLDDANGSLRGCIVRSKLQTGRESYALHYNDPLGPLGPEIKDADFVPWGSWIVAIPPCHR